MKHVFECDIVGESNDEVGDTFLASTMGITLPPTRDRRLPDDFTIEVPDRDYIRAGSIETGESLRSKYDSLCQGMIERGYTVYRWREEDKFCECIRFRRMKT